MFIVIISVGVVLIALFVTGNIFDRYDISSLRVLISLFRVAISLVIWPFFFHSFHFIAHKAEAYTIQTGNYVK